MDYLFCEWGDVGGSIQPQEKAVLEHDCQEVRHAILCACAYHSHCGPARVIP